jgi:hypothetical protein
MARNRSGSAGGLRRPCSKALVRRAFVLQVKDYLLKFDHLVLRTSSQEFKNFYEKVFNNSGWARRITWEVVPLR